MYNPIRSSKAFEQISAQSEQLIISGPLRSGDRSPSEQRKHIFSVPGGRA
ncbi:MAG TPA: hypothetical protein VH540_01790 [Ktedonobacterales bacterium]|jgi:DNA-binding transcriptional regulator YhcF (GntR family)